MGYDNGFLVFHEKLNPQAITGIEALDFTETVSAMDSEQSSLRAESFLAHFVLSIIFSQSSARSSLYLNATTYTAS